MNKPEHNTAKTVDRIQQRITDYSCGLAFESLPPEVIRAAKVRIIDTCGALMGGFFGAPCRIARNLAAQMPNSGGSTIIGTRTKTTPDMAAFANAITARYAEMNDSYLEGVAHGHPSDAVMPVLGVAEQARADGRALILSIVLTYEVFVRIADVFHNQEAFDTTSFAILGAAVGAGKLLGLTPSELSHAISMAVVPNVILKQVRRNNKTMFNAAAAGQAGRAGVFAAMLARAGMEGPHLPFEGKAGWCEHVAGEQFSLNNWGGKGEPFKVLQARVKARPCQGGNIACVLAAEKVAPLQNIDEVEQVTVEVHKRGKEHFTAFEKHFRNPDNKQAADHSLPYVVAATLMDGTLTLRSFDDVHLSNAALSALIQKINVVENEQFTQAYARKPREHQTRVTVVMRSGQQLVGEHRDDPSRPPTDEQIAAKFRTLSSDVLSPHQIDNILDRLWHLEAVKNVAEIPPLFVFD